MQGKPFALSSIHPRTSSHLRKHRTSVPPAKKIGLQTHLHPRCSQALPNHTPPSPKSHVIPPGPHSSTAQKPRNINDPISKPETLSGELRAKLGVGSAMSAARAGRGARGRRSGLAGLREDAPNHTPAHQAPQVWRAPEGPEGTGGLRGAAPNEVRSPSLAGGRTLRRPEHPWGHKQHQHVSGPPPTGTHSGPAQ